MKTFRMILSFGVLCAFSLLLPSTARAQVPQTFVSANGKDTNECNTPDKPCRSISGAITKVQGGGEVVIISSGSYQPFAVNKAVTVVAPAGVHAGITVSSGDGAAINTPPFDDVVLRGLTFNGIGGLTGIHYFAGGGLHVENCVINGFSSGIFFGSAGRLYVKDTVTKNNAGSGIYIGSSSGTVTALVDGSQFENNGNGVFCDQVGSARVTIRDSIASSSTFSGFSARIAPISAVVIEINIENCLVTGSQAAGIAASNVPGGTAGTTIISVSNTTIAHNFSGIFCGTGGVMRVSNTTITRTGTGVSASGGTVLSRGNNTLEGNDVDGLFTGPFLAK
jgi:hypothetical protein